MITKEMIIGWIVQGAAIAVGTGIAQYFILKHLEKSFSKMMKPFLNGLKSFKRRK